ncbi:molybdopterin molybdenumtransferase MoeA [Halovenus sp. WSH3]|uniref:Molybdopterin molybdenumtransferase MoeA n=1 Tax=Halovenus carboxidivorans TaxID=2692199 RepID=A0A6B0T7Y4_9EURY|nr:gephyrin-like molybdotransferase Glp [Halovenus carboxidivorans]MXR51301.1 molybdopterin molybdenumtransferase MoeA [Halovenus carboxidivorans]
MTGHSHSPFKDRASLTDAREALREQVSAHDRTEQVALGAAVGRTVAESITAQRNVPHYPRAAMDGYAVRAEDTFGASDRSPQILDATDEPVGPRQASQVHTGSKLPDGADAVVMIEHVDEVGEEIEVFDGVSEGENVGPVGEDVEAGQKLYDPGHRLRPSDVGLLRSVGNTEVTAFERPRVAVIPTGEELVQSDPDPGEIIETNGLTVSKLAESWGAEATYHDVVTDDTGKLDAAITDSLDHDLIATTGGSSVGKRDLLPEVVSELGEIHVHGVGIKPGHPFAFGTVEGTPVLMLPGYPVSCLINAVQFLRPAIKWVGSMPLDEPPTVEAELTEKVYSEPGLRTFARVRVDEEDGRRVATTVRASGAGVLSSVALSDGWVVVPEEREGLAEGETVPVQNWEWSP